MDKLRSIIEQHRRWQQLSILIDRIEAHVEVDFSLSVENAKALLETIAKEICKQHSVELKPDEKIQSLLKKAYKSLGYNNEDIANQISTSLSTIGQHMGKLRNEIGLTAHGRTLDEIRERNNSINEFTKVFLIDSTVLVACFLIQSFEQWVPQQPILKYEECEDFNEYWDGIFNDYSMGRYSFRASQVLFILNRSAYDDEYHTYETTLGNDNDH